MLHKARPGVRAGKVWTMQERNDLPPLRGLCADAPAGDGKAPPLATLSGHSLSFFWANAESGALLAAYGEAARVEAASPHGLSRLLASVTRADAIEWLEGANGAPERPPGPFFGAIAFDQHRPLGPSWQGFAPARFAAPRVAVYSARGRRRIAVFGEHPERELEAALRSLEAPARARGLPRMRVAAANGARHAWGKLVGDALARIAKGELHKVVLARAVDVLGDEAVPLTELLSALAVRHPTCLTFLLRSDAGSAFVGATPETFCKLAGAELSTEALAGSSRLDGADALLESAKDLREHAWVVDHALDALKTIADEVQAREHPEVRRLADLAHLHTLIRARLQPGRTLADVAEALHPTPAVGGVPSTAALRFIANEEKLDRGLYAGLVGVCGPDHAHLGVALRCALVRGNAARLYVGAGIVSGSTAEGEWTETELKTRPLLQVLGADR
jgi:salicylate biosynthesis isochorismate synthase